MFKSIFLFLVLLPLGVCGQQLKLSLNEAIDRGLMYSYEIKIAKNQTQIRTNNATIGNAGLLPSIGANAQSQSNNYNTHQEYANGQVIDRNHALSSNNSASVFLNWTIFNGFKLQTSYRRLIQLQKLSQEQLQNAINIKVKNIVLAYYDIYRRQKQLQAINHAMGIAKERLELADYKFKLGSTAKTDFLQAKIFANSLLTQKKQTQTELLQAKINLGNQIGLHADTLASVSDTLSPVHSIAPYDLLLNKVLNQNPGIQIAKHYQKVAQYLYNERKAERWPSINLNAGYNYIYNTSQASFALVNRNAGYYIGATASFNIFNGFAQSTLIKNARINMQSADAGLADTTLKMVNELRFQFENYKEKQQQYETELDNEKAAQELLNLSFETYKSGRINAYELKDAQQSAIDAEINALNALYELKSAEISLYTLSNDLDKYLR